MLTPIFYVVSFLRALYSYDIVDYTMDIEVVEVIHDAACYHYLLLHLHSLSPLLSILTT